MGTKYDTKYTNVVSILSIIYTNVVKYIYLIRVRDVCVPARKGANFCQQMGFIGKCWIVLTLCGCSVK